MPKLIKLAGDTVVETDDTFTDVGDEDVVSEGGDIIISLARFEAEGDALIAEGCNVGVRIQPDEAVETLAYDLPRLALVALVFPKYRDGRAYSAAVLLRERLGFKGQVRAVGDVLREQAGHMARCGFDAFVPADGSTPADWQAAIHRHRHVYQRAVDTRMPAFVEREG
jgi:uncharacterized protein (DUF934 family)